MVQLQVLNSDGLERQRWVKSTVGTVPSRSGLDPRRRPTWQVSLYSVVAAVTGEENRRLFGLKQLIYDVKLLTIFGKGMHYSFLFLAKAKTLNI